MNKRRRKSGGKIAVSLALLLVFFACMFAVGAYWMVLKTERDQVSYVGVLRVSATLKNAWAVASRKPAPNAVNSEQLFQMQDRVGSLIQEEFGDEKLVAITFDDGPSIYTDKLLDGLRERGIHVTFMVLGSRLDEYSEELEQEIQDGHQVGCHSWNHPELTKLGKDEITAQIEDTCELIRDAGYSGRIVVRPPYGSINDTVEEAVSAPMILWDVDTRDWDLQGKPDAIRNNILKYAHDGAIILLHDIYGSSVDGALDAFDRLKAEGYRFVTINELFAAKGITLENDGIYRSAATDD